MQAQGAPADYVTSAEVATGTAPAVPLDQPWLPADILRTGGTVSFTLGTAPNTAWGAGPGSAPPSYSQGAAPAVAFTSPTGVLEAPVGTPAELTLGLQSDVAGPTTVLWSASAHGVTLAPSSGQLVLPAASGGTYPRADTTVHLTASAAGTQDVQFRFSVPGSSARIPSLTVQVATP